jgi:hypothetical protein
VLPRVIQEVFAQVAEKSHGRTGGPSTDAAPATVDDEARSGAGAVSGTGAPTSTAATARVFRVRVSYLQLYNEQVYDLLNPSHGTISAELGRGGRVPGLRVRWAKTDDFYVENVFICECNTPDEVCGGRAGYLARASLALPRLASPHSALPCPASSRFSGGGILASRYSAENHGVSQHECILQSIALLVSDSR